MMEMKAAVYRKYGSPDVLNIEEVEKRVAGNKDVLIKIHATTVTSGDVRMRTADPFLVRFFNGFTTPKIKILGNEFAGVIESVGSEVKQFKIGDSVFGQTGLTLGGNAEYIVLPEDGSFAQKPSNLSFEESAAIPFGASTALHFLRKGNIKSGNKVLIYGASGSLGTAAVQLAKHFGAEVTAVCSTANLGLVKSLGAAHTIDYTKQHFAPSPESYDIIFDTIGKSPFAASVKALKKSGSYLRAVHMDLSSILHGIWTSLTSSKKVIGGIAAESRENIIFLRELIEAGELKPVIDKIYPLGQIAEAHRYVETGHKKGNVVITLQPVAKY